MELELQRLREEMAQLRAENERLSVRTENETPSSQASASTGEVPATPQRREQTVYLPKERKCPRFSGSSGAGAITGGVGGRGRELLEGKTHV